MKFKIHKRDITNVLSQLQGITGRKTSLSITTNIIIKALDNGIIIQATDLETGFTGFYPCAVEREGVIAINSRKFYEIIKELPDDMVLVDEFQDKFIKIISQNIEYHLLGMNHNDFPEVQEIEDVEFFEINSISFKTMLERVSPIGLVDNDNRPHITGIYLQFINEEDKRIRIVSTDGKRLSKSDYLYEKSENIPQFPDSFSVIIPKKGINEVTKFLDFEGIVKIGTKQSNVIIKKENETIIVRLLEGQYPDFDNIMNVTEENNIIVSKSLFLMMLRRMSILASDDYKGVNFFFNDNQLLIKTTNPDVGESKENLEINYTKEPVEVSFNPKFFIDALNVIETENVEVNIIGEENPCIIRGEEDKSFISVIMPMKV